MKEANVTTEELRTDIDERLEPIVLARVSEVTGTEPNDGDGDIVDNVVWGNKP